jgi:hypothetical protein
MLGETISENKTWDDERVDELEVELEVTSLDV